MTPTIARLHSLTVLVVATDGDTALVRAECFGSWSVPTADLVPVVFVDRHREERREWREHVVGQRRRLGTTDAERGAWDEGHA